MKRLLGAAALTVSTLSANAETALEAEYLEATLGAWSTKAQSVDARYDWVGSEKWRILVEDETGIWIYQENTIFGPNPEVEFGATPPPYFQVAVHLRDLGEGLLHTTTYRVADRASARAFATGEIDRFERGWLGDVACMGRMERVGDGFWNGSATCPNGYKGSVRLDSRSIFAPGYFVNWDRGFDASGAHSWGPKTGGYIFRKVESTK